MPRDTTDIPGWLGQDRLHPDDRKALHDAVGFPALPQPHTIHTVPAGPTRREPEAPRPMTKRAARLQRRLRRGYKLRNNGLPVRHPKRRGR